MEGNTENFGNETLELYFLSLENVGEQLGPGANGKRNERENAATGCQGYAKSDDECIEKMRSWRMSSVGGLHEPLESLRHF